MIRTFPIMLALPGYFLYRDWLHLSLHFSSNPILSWPGFTYERLYWAFTYTFTIWKVFSLTLSSSIDLEDLTFSPLLEQCSSHILSFKVSANRCSYSTAFSVFISFVFLSTSIYSFVYVVSPFIMDPFTLFIVA